MTHILTSIVLQNTQATVYDQEHHFHENTGLITMNTSASWIDELKKLYDEAVNRYQNSQRGHEHVIPKTGHQFLDSIGTSAQELYDFVEDWVDDGEPPFSTVASITEVRREYFLTVQQGKRSEHNVDTSALPSGGEELGGYRWLPRIIAKARAKFRGEMSPDIMYGCGADRPFLRKVGMDPAEFLRLVWKAGEDKHVVLDGVIQQAQSTTPHSSN
jgi:hypothetical protein